MSHAATNWAIQQRGLKPATKLVLWYLADRHNADTGRCDPSQERLAEDCEMSRAGLNLHLRTLEERGLIRRIRNVDPRTKRQERTSYQLAFEHDFSTPEGSLPSQDVDSAPQDVAEPSPKTGHGAVSRKSPKPCPKNRESRVQSLDTNPVREPGREPCARARGRETARAGPAAGSGAPVPARTGVHAAAPLASPFAPRPVDMERRRAFLDELAEEFPIVRRPPG